MITYRQAGENDARDIALLHASNWQLNYRGILDDYYLDNEVIADRKTVWGSRFQKSEKSMCLILAESGSDLVGFGCAFLNESEQYGAYLDNLHVAADFSGRGIGKMLMGLLAEEIIRKSSRSDMYLWVLTDNKGAIRLYEKLGGQRKEQLMEKEIGNKPVEKVRYYWPDVQDLIKRKSQ